MTVYVWCRLKPETPLDIVKGFSAPYSIYCSECEQHVKLHHINVVRYYPNGKYSVNKKQYTGKPKKEVPFKHFWVTSSQRRLLEELWTMGFRWPRLSGRGYTSKLMVNVVEVP